jgi:MOSC domain-containing protein YiiM
VTAHTGILFAMHVSDGGVPKTAIAAGRVGTGGLEGDRQENLKHHGGPDRALCLLGLDAIERLAAEGHPITPGSTGENLTLAGIHWGDLTAGQRLLFSEGVELELTQPAVPCRNIAASFQRGDFPRMHAEKHPGETRHYCRVLRGGQLTMGESFQVLGARS